MIPDPKDHMDSLSSTSHFKTRRIFESIYANIFFILAILTIFTTIGIIYFLFEDAIVFFSQYSPLKFLTSSNWSPVIPPKEYGILPLLFGTLVVTFMAALVAVPIGTLTAVYLSEYADKRTHSILKPLLEILAGVPTVVYGFFALAYVTPALRILFPSISPFNALSASLMVGIMIIPMVSSISEDAMSAVPDSLRQAGFGLGATKFDVSTSIVIPAALSGIVASYILAISRAIGETMIVTVAMGLHPTLPDVRYIGPIPYVHPADFLLETGQTMTAAMVQLAQSDLVGSSVAYNSLFAIGITLFFVTLLMNAISNFITERYRESY
ncbi:MAG: phosphate ABC transporter permease subunit PstC [Halobacteriales archaeon]|nr:phosphate ABC transporter permease subunit PstC [Halobacteriales archaeon]|tara:strand:+ start:3028 stop:4002 length:975 start_codon:yes stop_codon:yes gene_type:complete